MKLKNIFIYGAFAGSMALSSCHDLDIQPVNILTGEDIYNEGGITAYMADLYSRLPMEDFATTTTSDFSTCEGYFGWNCITWDQVTTGETVNHNNISMATAKLMNGYWACGYQLIRNANVLIQDLPAYIGTLQGAEEWIAEAKFIRAYTYFNMVHRYGGVPIVEEPQELTDNNEDLWVARNSHEESVDFILNDLDYAIQNLGTTKVNGRANKYVAAAFKSRVALYAASIARYGQQFTHTVDGVMVCGIPESKATDYYKQAYDAALVVEEGGYSLYRNNSDKAENFRMLFLDADKSSESIFIRQYDLNNQVHSFDYIYCPPRMTTSYGSRFNVTLDWIELFDGLPLDPNTGRLKTTDDEGNYIVYDGEQALYEGAEPRLLGSIFIPGNTYKGVVYDIRSGLIDESVDPSEKIQKFVADDGETTTAWTAASPWFAEHVKTTGETVFNQTPYETSTGVQLKIQGMDGPGNGGTTNTLTGLQGIKWLDLTLSVSETNIDKMVHPWIDIRYAEVLLNRAEAAIELAQSGTGSYSGHNMLDDAMACINDIRDRAGATLLTSTAELSDQAIENRRGSGKNSFVFAPNKGLHAVRVERVKELAFEHEVYWSYRRWFTFDQQINNYRRRMLAPFLFAKGATIGENGNPDGKYIYDTRVCERASDRITFDTKYYYDQVPESQLKINPLLVQNAQF